METDVLESPAKSKRPSDWSFVFAFNVAAFCAAVVTVAAYDSDGILHHRGWYSVVFFAAWAGVVAVLGVWLYWSRDSGKRVAALAIAMLGVAVLAVVLWHGAFDHTRPSYWPGGPGW